LGSPLHSVALAIAGSDSCGGAGIQADLKTMQALGVYGASVVTAVTAQSTAGVRRSLTLEPSLVAAQIDAVLEDVTPAATKIGMLASGGIMQAVADRAAAHRLVNLVVDPVMVATSGSLLIEHDAVNVMRDVVVPLADVLTPNIPELETLARIEVVTEHDMERAAASLLARGAGGVLVKGGHREGPAIDILFTEGGAVEFSAERIGAGTLHGTGCTVSSAIASFLALGSGLEDAVRCAKAFVTEAIRGAFDVGGGGALLDHGRAGRLFRRDPGEEGA
jgi:hydroxymethylpyrimidine/phosphomethylpyrimidine kinase